MNSYSLAMILIKKFQLSCCYRTHLLDRKLQILFHSILKDLLLKNPNRYYFLVQNHKKIRGFSNKTMLFSYKIPRNQRSTLTKDVSIFPSIEWMKSNLMIIYWPWLLLKNTFTSSSMSDHQVTTCQENVKELFFISNKIEILLLYP